MEQSKNSVTISLNDFRELEEAANILEKMDAESESLIRFVYRPSFFDYYEEKDPGRLKIISVGNDELLKKAIEQNKEFYKELSEVNKLLTQEKHTSDKHHAKYVDQKGWTTALTVVCAILLAIVITQNFII